MTFVKMANLPLVVALFLGTTLGGMSESHAGFQIGSASGTANQSAPIAAMPAPTQMDGTPLPKGVQEKAFQVYEDRYVPDSIRKKYNLNDNWFGKNSAPESIQSDPTLLAPSGPDVLEINANGTNSVPLQAQPQSQPQVQAPVEAKAVVESWRGRKGENIHDVLQRWATRAGTTLMWASPDAPKLQKEFTYVGKFQDAVNELIRVEGGNKVHSQYRSEGLNPVMMSPASTVTTNTAPAPEALPVPEEKASNNPLAPLAKAFQPKEEKETKPETRWFALSGAPLAEVIRVWADDAGVQVIWQSEKNFAVKETVSQVGHFEDAVFKALNQYSEEDIRPVGEMYRDPASGQQVLLVRTEVSR